MNFNSVFYFLCALCTKRQRTTGLVVTISTDKFNCIWSTQYIYVLLIFLKTNATLYGIQRLVFLMQAGSVLCEIRTEDLHKKWKISFSLQNDNKAL